MRRPLGALVEPIVEQYESGGYRLKLRSVSLTQHIHPLTKTALSNRTIRPRPSPQAEDPDRKEAEVVELTIEKEREHASATATIRSLNSEIAALNIKHASSVRATKELESTIREQASTIREKASTMRTMKELHEEHVKVLHGQLHARIETSAAILAKNQESVERAHNRRDYAEDLMKDYEDETRDARRAAKDAEEAAKLAKSEARAARKERDELIALITASSQAGAVLGESILHRQIISRAYHTYRLFYL